MRTLCLFVLIISFSFTAVADCISYGDARGSNDEGVLCEFGDQDESFPNEQFAQPRPRYKARHQEGMLTPQEEWGVVRGLVTRYRGSDPSIRGALVGGTRPLGFMGRQSVTVR